MSATLAEALRALHDDIAGYARINNLGGFDNHAMRQARAALAAHGAQPTQIPRWWTCATHGDAMPHNAWGCPECVREMRETIRKHDAQPTYNMSPGEVSAVGRALARSVRFVDDAQPPEPPGVPAMAWEALQRMIEDAAARGPASREDALAVAQWRRRLMTEAQPAQEPVAIVVGTGHLGGSVVWRKPNSLGLPLNTNLYAAPAPDRG